MSSGLTPRSRASLSKAQREANIAKSKSDLKHGRDHVSKHYIYRCFDREGQLLYIGCTMDVDARMQVHHSSWQNPASAYLCLHMDHYEVEGPFIGRIAGRKAEREAIAAEKPLLNLHHNKGRGLSRAPGRQPTGEEWAHLTDGVAFLFEQPSDGAE